MVPLVIEGESKTFGLLEKCGFIIWTFYNLCVDYEILQYMLFVHSLNVSYVCVFCVQVALKLQGFTDISLNLLLDCNAIYLKLNSGTMLLGEQPNPWDLLQPQDMISQHRGAKQFRRYGL